MFNMTQSCTVSFAPEKKICKPANTSDETFPSKKKRSDLSEQIGSLLNLGIVSFYGLKIKNECMIFLIDSIISALQHQLPATVPT